MACIYQCDETHQTIQKSERLLRGVQYEITVGSPSGRIFPSPLGMNTRFTSFAWYRLFFNSSMVAWMLLSKSLA